MFQKNMEFFFMLKKSFLIFFSLFSLLLSADDFQQLTANYNRILKPGRADLGKADKIVADQNSDGSFKSVKYDDKSRGLWNGMKHWYNLRDLSAAWNKTGNTKYLDAIISGLNYWATAEPVNRNWWWQEIGVPFQAIRVINNMNGAVPQDTLEKLRTLFNKSKLSMTGQNLFDAASIHVWKGVIYRDFEIVPQGVDAIKSVLKIVPPGKEGLQYDYSFHQHGPQLQFGNYGRGYFENGTLWMMLLEGTSYAMSPEQKELLFNYFYDGLRWVCYKKQMDYLACGRQITGGAPEGKYKQIAGFVLRFGNQNAMKEKVRAFFKNDSLLEGSRYFFRSDYLVHRRNGVYFSYKMCSNRVIGSETINSENLQGLYLGCGVMQYKQSGREYDRMAALWNWRRLPGLTAVYDNDSLNASRARHKTNISSAVGAVSDNMNSSIMMECKSQKLGYTKSVTAIDRRVVFCLNNIFKS